MSALRGLAYDLADVDSRCWCYAVRTSNIVPRLNSDEPPALKTPALFSMIALAQ